MDDHVGERALVPRPRRSRLDFARNLREARPDQVIALNARGGVRGPGDTVAEVAKFAAIAGTSIFGSGLVAGLVSPLGGVVAPLLAFAGLLWWVQEHGELANAVKPFVDDDLHATEQRLARLGAKFLVSRNVRAHVHHLRGSVFWRQGRLADALAEKDRAMRVIERSVWPGKTTAWWLALFDRVQLLAVLGRLDEAMVELERLDGAPRGDFFEMESCHTRLTVAYHAGSTTLLPDDLHAWVRRSLATTMWGGTVALLAWAYADRGDPDMADHLVIEAQERLTAWHLERTYPHLDRWVRARLARVTASA